MKDEIKRIRNSTGLSQKNFAKRYGLVLESLRNWEQGRRFPDQSSIVYLRVIEKIPEEVANAVVQILAK